MELIIEQMIYRMQQNQLIKIVCVLIIMDAFFGCMCAVLKKKLNSSIGIYGIIRKCGMIASLLFFLTIDILENINMFGFLPEDIQKGLNLECVGICDLFAILYIIYEALSVLKNMMKCGLPIPHKIKTLLEKLLTEMTEEIIKEPEETKEEEAINDEN